ncbi:MAG: RsmB/NOP family class I SAM-dependent RNA methyltransferase [Euryarchaeota archaeon]|jgi:16S rRNA (cytosine967-C5)-methyltransferase|nr:RsmB/NOP family class I SAM-dependent RNA methyltransferase [Euryarchaeota archaeon]
MATTLGVILQELSPAMIETVRVVFWQNVYATKAIEQTLKLYPEWEDSKRAVFSDTIYDLIRWWRPLWYIIDKEPSTNEEDIQNLITIYLFSKKGDLPALQKNKGLDATQLLQRIKTTKISRALRESVPDWLDAQGEKELGTRWEPVLVALNKKPELVIRANSLKTTTKELLVILRKEGIAAEGIDGNPDAVFIKEKINVFKLPSFNAGLFEVQDAASQMASRILDPQPGMRIVDACAGEGSKTLHLAALLKNKGKIIAMDTQDWRLRQLKKRAAKAGVDTVETRLITSSKVYKRIKGTADRLLLDVPCSGLGTLRRNPDIKWKLTATDLERLRNLQQDLLEKYCTLLKPLGTMVYSVCSILPSEGEEQIQRFLKNHGKFRLLNEKRTWPDTDRTDGFYIALLQRAS